MDKLKLAALGERLKIGGERLKSGGAEMSRKVSGKMKEILQVQSQEIKMVDEATSGALAEPNWGLNLRICALLNSGELNGPEVVRTIKKKIAGKNAVSQMLSLDLLEVCTMNCDKVFSIVASEKVLDEMMKMIDNPQTHHSNKQRAMQLIRAWGESNDLAYLPVFQQTYKSLKARRIPVSIPGDAHSSSLEPGINELLVSPGRYPYPDLDQETADTNFVAYHGSLLPTEEKKKILTVTRNSMEILESILNSDTQQKATKDELTLSMLKKCQESLPVIERIIESVGADEEMLFEALNLHEELEKVISRYKEMEAAVPEGQTLDGSGSTRDAVTNGKDAKSSSPAGLSSETLFLSDGKSINLKE